MAECFNFQLMETKPAKQTFIQTIFGKKDGCGEKKGSNNALRTLLRDC